MSSSDSDTEVCSVDNVSNTNENNTNESDTFNNTKSNITNETNDNKVGDELEDKVMECIRIEELLKEKSDLFNKKKDLEESILRTLEDRKLDSITVDGKTIKRVEKSKKESIKKKDMKTKILNDMKEEGFVKSDGSVKSHVDGNAFIQTILDAMDKRPVSKIYKLEMKGGNGVKKTTKKTTKK